MAPHIQTAFILIGILAFIIGLLIFINNKDRKKNRSPIE
jgi:hypothetical protein